MLQIAGGIIIAVVILFIIGAINYFVSKKIGWMNVLVYGLVFFIFSFIYILSRN